MKFLSSIMNDNCYLNEIQRAYSFEMSFAILTDTPQAFHTKTEGRAQRTLGKRPCSQES